MKTVKMKLGTGYVDVSVPEENLLGMIVKEIPSSPMTEDDVVLDALAHPIGTPRLRELVKPGNTVCIVVSDVTRAWQRMSVYLPHIVKELNEAGVKDKDICFLSALGYHRKHTPEEHAKLLGPELLKRFQIIDHDCLDKNNLVQVGKTSRGTPVIINRIAAEADCLVLTGCCTYHPWVGYGGGKKSILPGISSIESIQKNHLMTMDELGRQRPEVASGNIKDNPIHLDMLEVAAIVKPTFMFNVIMGHDGKIARAVCGDCLAAHDVGRNIVDELYEVPIKELADITISSQGGYPKDIDVCQTGKGVYHTQAATKPGGWIIILSDCTEGIGPPDANTIFLECETNAEREREVRKLFTVPKYVSYYMCTAAEQWNIIIVGNGDPALLAKTKFRTARTVDEALEIALKEGGRNQKIYLMPQGSSALPKLKKI
ncbi:MAG TPA: nickel-dependent lactate racemase [Acidobacteriota bacterium]|nr:nickel-dependent lactate racemase [Acidobacteriota bacterium]